jgi:hypothetical protein
VTQDATDRLQLCAIVVQASSESAAECVEAVPLNACAFESGLDVLRPECRQVERKDPWTLKYPLSARIRLAMLLQFGDNVR